MNPELIYKYLENTATDAETEQVLDWLDADPAHMRELDELDKVMAASVIYGPDVLSPAPAKKAARRISLGRIPLRRIVRYAAELAAVAVVGIGVNVEAPAELCAVGGKNAAAYTADLAAGPVSIVQVRDAVLGELARCYERWQAEGFAAFAEEYGRCAALTGRQVRVERADGSDIACGTVQGVDEAGALIVQDGRRQVPVTSGEAHITQL